MCKRVSDVSKLSDVAPLPTWSYKQYDNAYASHLFLLEVQQKTFALQYSSSVSLKVDGNEKLGRSKQRQ
jgi:hypothetical protein